MEETCVWVAEVGPVVGADELGRASWWYIYYRISHRPSRLKHGLMGMGSRVVCHLDHIAGRHVADHACTTTVVRDFSVQYPVYLVTRLILLLPEVKALIKYSDLHRSITKP